MRNRLSLRGTDMRSGTASLGLAIATNLCPAHRRVDLTCQPVKTLQRSQNHKVQSITRWHVD